MSPPSGPVHGAGPAAGDLRIGPLGALAALDHVAMVGGQHHDPAGQPGLAEQRSQVPDRCGGPLGAARIGPVERVVDGVEHAGDQPPAGHVGDCRPHVRPERLAGRRGVQSRLVRQRRGRDVVLRAERVVALPLDFLAAGHQLPGEQRGPARLGERRQCRERRGPPGRAGQPRLGPALARQREHVRDDLGGVARRHAVEYQQQHRGLAGDREDDCGQHVLDPPQARIDSGATGCGGLSRPPGEHMGELTVVRVAPGGHRAKHRGQPGGQVGVARAGRRVVDGASPPRRRPACAARRVQPDGQQARPDLGRHGHRPGTWPAGRRRETPRSWRRGG